MPLLKIKLAWLGTGIPDLNNTPTNRSEAILKGFEDSEPWQGVLALNS